jgi:transcription initiation factor TFIID TATA-box-binding protein
MAEVKIENIVASTTIAKELNLNAIGVSIPESEYEPEQFPGLVLRIKQPKAATLLFRSGKVVCTGAKSLVDVKEVIKQVCEKIKIAGFEVFDNPDIKVQNIVASADLHSELNLNAIAVGLGLDRVEYEPEQFPGLVYRLDEPKAVTLIFGSGKLICTGAKKAEAASRAVDKITEQLEALGFLSR